MPRYLISFDDGAMTFPEEDLPEVARAAHEVVRAAQEAGVWVFGRRAGGSRGDHRGHRRDGHRHRLPAGQGDLGGFAVVDVLSRQKALGWAARIAVACRCAQGLRELMPDPDV